MTIARCLPKSSGGTAVRARRNWIRGLILNGNTYVRMPQSDDACESRKFLPLADLRHLTYFSEYCEKMGVGGRLGGPWLPHLSLPKAAAVQRGIKARPIGLTADKAAPIGTAWRGEETPQGCRDSRGNRQDYRNAYGSNELGGVREYGEKIFPAQSQKEYRFHGHARPRDWRSNIRHDGGYGATGPLLGPPIYWWYWIRQAAE